MRLEPLADNLVVRLVEVAPQPGLIQVVRAEAQPSMLADVVAVGPDVRDTRVGQRVLVSRLQGIAVNLSEPLVLLPESAVLAYMETT